MNVVSLTNKRDWKWHRDRIAAAWGKQVESIIETGQALIDAKEELVHGSFEAMVQTKLPFAKTIAYNVRKIAENKVLSNVRNREHLPSHLVTLYELSRLPEDILIVALKDGSIHPKLKRSEVRALRPDFKPKPPRPHAEPKLPPLAPITEEQALERIITSWRELPRTERRHAFNKLMKAVDMDIHDWVSTMSIPTRKSRR